MSGSIASRSVSLPPPVGGWDTRESLADMPPDRAVQLDNWFPSTDKVTVRRGYSEHASGLGAAVESIMPYIPTTGTPVLFAAAGTSVWNVTAGGAVGAAVLTSTGNARWQFVNFGNTASQILFICNGATTPRTFNGSVWANSTLSAVNFTASNVIWCNIHQRRLWVGETNSLDAWYTATDTFGGAPSRFPLMGVFKRGGFIMGMGTWTRDGGAGAEDVAVFLTSEGEAAVYAGTDPSSASTWTLQGVFEIGRPIGRRCFQKAGADLLILTEDGAVLASQILPVDRAQAERAAVTAQINKAFNNSVRDHGSVYGWQAITYPRGTALIFNVPQGVDVNGNNIAHQYVFNTITRAPCRFTGINAVCWGLSGDTLYFGGYDGKVYEFDTVNGDAGNPISSNALQAFNYLKSPGQNKTFMLAEPVFESDGLVNAEVATEVDFLSTSDTLPTPALSTAGVWGVSLWGAATSLWGTPMQIQRGWVGVDGIGRSVGVRVKVRSSTISASWIATNLTFVPGGQL